MKKQENVASFMQKINDKTDKQIEHIVVRDNINAHNIGVVKGGRL